MGDSLGKIFTELRRRNIFRLAGVYAVVGWLLMQAASITFPAFGAPDWVLKSIIGLVLIGFPLALLLAWAFEMTPEGVKRTEAVTEADSITARTGRGLDYVILAGLGLVVLMMLWQGARFPANNLKPQHGNSPAKRVQMSAVIAAIMKLPDYEVIKDNPKMISLVEDYVPDFARADAVFSKYIAPACFYGPEAKP